MKLFGESEFEVIIFRDMAKVKERMGLKRIAITEKGRDTAENLRAQAVYKQTGFLPDMPDPCTQFHISLEDYKA